MDNIDEKLREIRSNYFRNIFNEDYVNDSYEFLDGIKFFSVIKEENKISMFSNVYQNDIIFKQIKELHSHHKAIIEQEQKEKLQLKPKYSIYKLRNMYLEKLKNLSKHDEGEQTEESEKKENKYASLMEKLFKKRQEDDLKEKEFQEKCESALSLYESDELIDFFKIIYVDEKAKNKIFLERGVFMKDTVTYEQEVLNYFLNESNNKKDYKKVNNNDLSIYYKLEQKGGLTLLFEKEININIVHLLSLIYEVEYYPKWFPFNKVSKCIQQPGKAKKLVYMVSNMPVISDRDFLIYGFGVNQLKHNNTIYLLCRSVNEDSQIFKDEYAKTANKKYVRAEIRIFGFEIKVINKNKVNVKALINTDPKIGFIPQWLINSISQKFATDLFTKLVDISKKFEGSEYQNKNPSKTDKMFYDYLEKEIRNLNLEEGSSISTVNARKK